MIPHITAQLIYLTVDTNKDQKKVKYRISIMMKDSSGKQYLFHSAEQYQYDESGQAYADLEVVQTADNKK